ncbi:hypothetical protein [Paenibacillus silvisoli]|uniref:hypothetical protein n=1 Tax=Paenibacillus silvisoli TaxID=3110539 RepID=UPI002804E5BA|nr:hypothetical protein [Paenibacillus silvisoli]
MNRRPYYRFLLFFLALFLLSTSLEIQASGASKIVEVPGPGDGIFHLTGVLGFKTFVDRKKLPAFARNFTGISVYSNDKPLRAKEKGVSKFAVIPDAYSNRGYASAGFVKGGTYYVITILYDANNKPLVFQETAVKLAGNGKELPVSPKKPPKPLEVTTGIKHVLGIMGFKTIVDRTKLPAFAKSFSRIGVASLKAPFGVSLAGGIREFAGYSEPYQESGYSSGLPYSGYNYALTILYDEENKPIAYQEALLYIPRNLRSYRNSRVRRSRRKN